jgi:hypothetical protein
LIKTVAGGVTTVLLDDLSHEFSLVTGGGVPDKSADDMRNRVPAVAHAEPGQLGQHGDAGNAEPSLELPSLRRRAR